MTTPPPGRRARLLAYTVALVVTAAAALATRTLGPLLDPDVPPVFLLGIAVAAVYGGLGPGVLASVLSLAVLVAWYFPPPIAGGPAGPADIARELVFVAAASGICWIGAAAYRARQQAVAHARENDLLRQRAEDAMMEAEAQTEALREGTEAAARLAAIVTSSGDAVVGKTFDGVVISWNAAAERIFGYRADEMVGSSIYRLIPEEHHDAERELLRRVRQGEVVQIAETERIRKDGRRIWISLSVSPVRDPGGALIGAASIKRDITEERQAQFALRRQEEQLRLAHQAARMGTWRWEVASNSLTWDDGLRRLFGLGQDDPVGDYDGFIRRVHPEDRRRVDAIVQRALAGRGSLDYEFRIVLPNGEVRWLADMGRVTTDEQGRPVSLTGICMDVTERRSMEEHLRETQRLQATGQLAGGIAHEANNQMSVVLGATHFLLRRTDLAEAVRQDVTLIRQAAERTASITQQLLAFSRRQILRLEEVDLNAVVTAAEPLLRRSLAEGQRLVIRPGPVEDKIRADPRQLEQVLLNLTLNARDAMPGGGLVTIETTETDPGGPGPGRYALVVVRDTGRGMDRATLQRAFEPFFTTKEVGQGTGLGLSVVHGIVSQTGGQVRVDSEPGAGTTFTLYFPAAAPSADAGQAASLETGAPDAGTVVLVVEDDAPVRRMTTRALREAGYQTLEAESGREALDLIRQRQGRLDLVVSDIGLPEMDGYELARRLEQERPDLPLLYMSGYVDEQALLRGAHRPDWPLLRKPFPPAELVRMAGEVLAGAARRGVAAGNRTGSGSVSPG
jgi:PAS domain S-box-containing protein